MALARELLKSSRLSHSCDFTKISQAGCLNNLFVYVSVRTAKHYNPKFKWHRSQKVIKVPLPHEEDDKETSRTRLFKMGIVPRYWKARPITITSTQEVIDPYEPVEGDSKASMLSTKVVKDVTIASKKKIATLRAVRKIQSYETNFKVDTFPQEAQDIYINAHTVLMKKDAEELSKYVTEYANMKMMEGIKKCTIRWKFLELLEPPRVVQARVQEIIKATNLFAQVTVKFHSKQTLAVYDRFGRLMQGSEFLPKDVLEFVVFEKHINNEYGEWRLHDKIIPDWVPKLNLGRTYRIEEIREEDFTDDIIEEDQDIEGEKAIAEVVSSGKDAQTQATVKE